MAAPALPPGPRLPGPAQAVLWALRYPQFTRAGHERFGSTFTVRPGTMPRVVVTSDRDAIRRLLTGDPLSRAHANDAVRPLIGGRSILLLEPREHLARRKLLLPPFHGERVRGYAALMQELIDAEVDRWRPGRAVEVLPVALDLTIEVILRAVLGVADHDLRARLRELLDDLLAYPFAGLRRRLGRPGGWAPGFPASLATPAVMTYFPELKTRSRWNVGTAVWWRSRDRFLALLDEHVEATVADPRLAERDDILAMLVQARDADGRGLSREDLHDDLVTLIGAGHETTATGIAWGAALLAHHPEAQERVREAGDAGLASLVREVLRLRPPIPVGAGRRLAEPFAVGGHVVPPGTPIAIDAWNLHRDPALYPDPERFDPERFRDGPPEPYSWLPFGGGARRCLGAALAELEMKVVLGTLLRRVRLEPTGPELPAPVRRGITIVPAGGARVRVA